MNLTELFCPVDDFWMAFEPEWQANQVRSGTKQRFREGQLCESEIMTILIYFHQARYREFKTYYTRYVQVHLQGEFPQLVSYRRFVQWIPRVLVVLCAYLYYCFGQCTGISLIDSTPLAVSHNRRIAQHKTFAGVAQRGKNSVGSSASNCIWSSTIVASCWRVVSCPATPMTVAPFPNWSSVCLASCLVTIDWHKCIMRDNVKAKPVNRGSYRPRKTDTQEDD
jgi:hypothetical protein